MNDNNYCLDLNEQIGNNNRKIKDLRIIRLILQKLRLDSSLLYAKKIYKKNEENLEASIRDIFDNGLIDSIKEGVLIEKR